MSVLSWPPLLSLLIAAETGYAPPPSLPLSFPSPAAPHNKVGYELFRERCSSCHAQSVSVQAPYVGAQWYFVVARMMLMPDSGMSVDEARFIGRYLSWVSTDRLRRVEAYPGHLFWLLDLFLRLHPEKLPMIEETIATLSGNAFHTISDLIAQKELDSELLHGLSKAMNVLSIHQKMVIGATKTGSSRTPGQYIYRWYCGSCHAIDGEGTKHGSKLNDALSLQLYFSQGPRLYRDVISHGREKSSMPAYGRSRLGVLNENQIDSIITFFREEWLGQVKDDQRIHIQEREPFSSDTDETKGEELFRARCSSCHGTFKEPKGVYLFGSDYMGYKGLPKDEAPVDIRLAHDRYAPNGMTNTIVREIIRLGRGSMPPFGSIRPPYKGIPLSSGEIDSIVMYLRKKTYHEQIRKMSAGTSTDESSLFSWLSAWASTIWEPAQQTPN